MENSIDNLKTFDDDFTPYAAELKEGQFLGENKNYRLEKNLGAGGMGEVWLASEIRGGVEIRKVVVKTLRPDRRENLGAQEKALKQFQLIQRLNHQSICPIYVIEQDPACGYLVVMGYADGGSYADWFDSKPKPLAEVCDVLRPITDALDFAHSKGVIHRDVKPANMMFTSDKTPWLIDFGIAANLRSATQATQGQFSQSGTVSYMAPEQKSGELQTAQTDEYSLAMVALEFLTGTTFLQAVQELSPEIQNVLNNALALKPEKRYATCRAFIDALSGAIRKDGGSPSAAGPAAKTAIDQIAEAERLAAEAKRRAEEEALQKKIQSLDESVAEEYQSGRYAEAIAHLNEILQLKPDHQNAKWLLNSATQKWEAQKKAEAERKAREEAERKERERKAREEANRKAREEAERKERERKAREEANRKAREEAERKEREYFAREAANAGKRKVLMADGIEYAFRWCPPGEFIMGGNKYDNEKPVHKVKLTKGFWMLETQVTQAMWQNVMGNNPSYFNGRGFLGFGGYNASNFPVEQVSWDDCQSFCKKLSQKLGRQVKLPTEAQWEYACRAGTTGDYAGTLDEMAWYDSNSGSTTHAVGRKKPNAWGLYDMHGNVWEWCSDWYDENYYSKSPTSDPENTTSSSSRVYRGGGWISSAEYCRSARRFWSTHDGRYDSLGLRVLLVPSPEK